MNNKANQKDKLNFLLKELAGGDKSRFYFACLEGDLKTQHEISKKYNVIFDLNLKKSLRDDFIDIFLSGSLEKAQCNYREFENLLLETAGELLSENIFGIDTKIDSIDKLPLIDSEINKNDVDDAIGFGLNKKLIVLKQAYDLLRLAKCNNTADEILKIFRVELCELLLGELRVKLRYKEIQSEKAKENASKPRHKYYDEVISVIKATWDKYPNASQTGILEALCSHYYGKVSRNALNSWIVNSKLRPARPQKYSSFELVIPQ